MKIIIAFTALAAVALAAPPLSPQETVLVRETPSDNVGLGNYNYAYQLSDGQTKQESAEVVNAGTDDQFLKVQGSYSFADPNTNVVYTVNYVADETGFHPQGEHLPHA
ncbi:unnamed protein product [Xylocopa violacea]|uniref:Larval cuticle protein 8 n=1 Tax=Xylocopa violacea TaxID=135666 RepID=A0ABP1NTE0_XYLVO